MGQILYKNWLLVSKFIWGTWITSGRQWKSEKVKFNGLHLSKKYIPSAKILYTEDLSKITSNYCENSPNFVCHFWNHKPFFTTQLVSIFLAQKLHNFDKNIPLKCKFSDLPLLVLKFTKFVMSFLQSRASFSSNLASLISVMRDNSSALFHLNL